MVRIIDPQASSLSIYENLGGRYLPKEVLGRCFNGLNSKQPLSGV